MNNDHVKLTIDGHLLEAPKGETIIQVADEAGIYIPRFCYHKHLPIVANCRMCLVEVEGGPKPLPACSTPITEGMSVHTRSEHAIDAQRATMEFLLINHPLDCPVCDQGGECELQDLNLGFGRGVSRFTEAKRVVPNEQIGPLVDTAMTRCIHCTRCIRVLEEVGGRQEIGATGRGEHMKIGTYIKHSLNSELSGNIIDVCPVGALNSAPFKMQARGWELLSHVTVSPHDCLGSNLYGHSLRGKLLRVVPRENNSINDTWISDRDRFSYTGLTAPDRAKVPLIRRNGDLVQAEWGDALEYAAGILKKAGADLGAILSPSATLEEMYLAQKLIRRLGSHNIDTRIRQHDFRDDAGDPRFPSIGGGIREIGNADAILIIGSRLNKEVPILGYQVRKAVRKGSTVMVLNLRRYDLVLPVSHEQIVPPQQLVNALAALTQALAKEVSRSLPTFMSQFPPAEEYEFTPIAKRLAAAERACILLGHIAVQHSSFADLRRLGALLAELSDGRFGVVTEGANQAGAYLAGAVPHRGPGGVPVRSGMTTRSMFEKPLPAYFIWGIEPEFDCWNGPAARAALEAGSVVAVGSFIAPAMREYANCVLPVAAFGETSGSYVNAAGELQHFNAAAVPMGESRPGWKILRALGATAGLAREFNYIRLGEIHAELMGSIGGIPLAGASIDYSGNWEVRPGMPDNKALHAFIEVGPYAGDPLVRRAGPLQQTEDARQSSFAWISPDDAHELNISDGQPIRISGSGNSQVDLTVKSSKDVTRGAVWVPLGCGLPMHEQVMLSVIPVAAEA